MKDPIYPLKQAYFKLIAGKLTFKGINVPMYDSVVPAGATMPYILFSQIQSVPINTSNTNYCWRITVMLDIVTGYQGDFGGKTDSLLITDKLLGIIAPGRPMDAKPFNLKPWFNVAVTSVTNINTMDNLSETNRIIRNLVRFNHIIEQSV